MLWLYGMQATDGSIWNTDPELFASLPGGSEIIEWFGFAPSFHDATLAGIEILLGTAIIRIDTFRTTANVDDRGYFILDKNAQISITISDVTGVLLTGNGQSIIAELGIRRLSADKEGFATCDGPRAGDFEISFETSYGLEGSIFGRNIVLGFVPTAAR